MEDFAAEDAGLERWRSMGLKMFPEGN